MKQEIIKFSIIIPCYNTPIHFINRLLNSLTKQGIEKDQLQVIIVDDQSENKEFLDEIKTFEDKLNITYVETKEDWHTPANTREAGLSYVENEWLCFCDHDDMYEENALAQIEQFILKYHPPFAICGNMRSWNQKTNEYYDFIHKISWLHGKFYNMKHLIKPYNIHFYKDLWTHEDIGWNCQCQAAMYELNTDFTDADIMVYRWINEPTSITRCETNTRGYLHEYFNEYIQSASRPFFEGAKLGKWWFINQILMTFLHTYFYYIGAIYKNNKINYDDNLKDIQNYYNLILKELEITPKEIIKFIESDAQKYQKVREDCIMHEGYFIESISFSDFVNSLYIEKEK